MNTDTTAGKIVIMLLALLCVGIIIYTDFGRNRTVRYNCSDAHWHPDVPIEVKKQCIEFMKQQLEDSKKITT
jgi:hypothetical protein